MKIVEVLWEDAASDCRWKDQEDSDSFGCVMIRSIGYLFREDKDYIILVNSEALDEIGWMGHAAIPKACIETIWDITV